MASWPTPPHMRSRAPSDEGMNTLQVAATLGAAVLVVVGSFGTWATFLVFHVAGTSGDGWITFVLGAAAGIVLLAELVRPGGQPLLLIAAAGLALGAAGVVGVYDWVNVAAIPDADTELFGTLSIQVGWGLVLVTIAGWGGALAGMAIVVRRRNE